MRPGPARPAAAPGRSLGGRGECGSSFPSCLGIPSGSELNIPERTEWKGVSVRGFAIKLELLKTFFAGSGVVLTWERSRLCMKSIM